MKRRRFFAAVVAELAFLLGVLCFLWPNKLATRNKGRPGVWRWRGGQWEYVRMATVRPGDRIICGTDGHLRYGKVTGFPELVNGIWEVNAEIRTEDTIYA